MAALILTPTFPSEQCLRCVTEEKALWASPAIKMIFLQPGVAQVAWQVYLVAGMVHQPYWCMQQ